MLFIWKVRYMRKLIWLYLLVLAVSAQVPAPPLFSNGTLPTAAAAIRNMLYIWAGATTAFTCPAAGAGGSAGGSAVAVCVTADGTSWTALGGGSATWGGITGTLSSQTDLNTALGLKAPLASPAFTGNVTIGTTVLPGTAIATTASTTVNLAAGNNGQQIAFTAGTDVTLNITSSVAVQGFSILIIQRGAGSIVPTASGGGITIRQRQSLTKTAGQYAIATLSCDIAGDCILAGDLQ